MVGIPIDKLPLSIRSRNVLYDMSVYNVEDLLNVSLEDISKQKKCGKKTLSEIQQMISLVSNGEIELSADDNGTTTRHFSGEQLFEMSHHKISELNLSARPFHALCREGYTTIDQIVNFTENNYKQFKGLGKKSIDEMVQSVNSWLEGNGYVFPDGANVDFVSDEYRSACKEVAYALKSLFQASYYQISLWISDNGLEEKIRFKGELGDLENNIRVAVEMPQMQERLRAFWTIIAPDGIIGINDAEEKIISKSSSSVMKIIIESSYQNSLVCRHRNYFLIYRDNFNEYFANIYREEDRELQMVKMRIHGMSLQEIGEKFGLTRERVRQISTRMINRCPLLFEDYFAEPFTCFHITKSEFRKMFPEISDEGFEYLSIRYPKGKIDLCDETLLDYMGPWKELLSAYLNKQTDYIYKQTVTWTEMVYRILIYNMDTPLSMEEFEGEYYSYLNQNDYPVERLRVNRKTVMNYLRAEKNIVFNRDNKVRYCAANTKTIWETIDFSAYKNLVISAELIFRDYKDLMDDLDIRDGYELFYLLKKSIQNWKGDFSIVCRRVPIMLFGKGSEKEQAIRLLKEISPVEFADYYAAYEERFGVRKESAPGNPTISNALLPYAISGKYIFDASAIADEDIIPFVEALKYKSIWFIDEIEILFEQVCVHSSRDAINQAAFRRIGYILNVGYAFSESYGNATSYLDAEVFSKDIINMADLDRRLIDLPTFGSVFEKKKNSLEYIETAPKILLSRKKVQEIYGLTVEDIREIQLSLIEQYKKPYFNANSIWNEVENWPLIRRLNGNKWMLTCIMRQQDYVFTIHFSGNMVLSLDSSSLTLSKVCEWLVSLNGAMTVRSLTKALNETFGCNVSTYKVAEKIRSSGQWNKMLTDSMDDYIDNLVAYSEVEEDELLHEEFF